jgi:hypothetical protein
MEMRITFAVHRDEQTGGVADYADVEGLRPEDVTALDLVLAASGQVGSLSVENGETGKGASGPGVELVVSLVERGVTDAASMLGVGTALWALIAKVQSRRERRVEVQQPEAIGALALAAAINPAGGLTGSWIGQSVCLTGGGPGSGTDSRDVWATPVTLSSGDVRVIFSAPSGLVLGEVVVPPAWTSERGDLDSVSALVAFNRLNGFKEG